MFYSSFYSEMSLTLATLIRIGQQFKCVLSLFLYANPSLYRYNTTLVKSKQIIDNLTNYSSDDLTQKFKLLLLVRYFIYFPL